MASATAATVSCTVSQLSKRNAAFPNRRQWRDDLPSVPFYLRRFLEALRSRNAPMTAYFLGARDVLCSSCLVEVSNMAGFEDALNFRQGHGRYDLLGFTLVIDGGA